MRESSSTISTRELVRLIVAQVCLHACMAGMRMAAPLLALRAGYSAAAVGILLALFALTQVFLSIPAGRYIDRSGLRRPVGWCVVAAVAGAALAVAWPVYPTLCLSALLTGGATGVAVLALQRHVGRAAHDAQTRRRVFSWLAIGPAISNFIGPLTAGLCIDHLGFRAAFMVLAVLPALSWWTVREARELPLAQPDATPRRVLDLLHNAMLRRLLLINWLLSSCWDVHTFVVPVLGHERGLSAATIGTILGAFALAATAVRLVLPVLAAGLRDGTVVVLALVVTTLVLGLYPFARSAWSMGLCSVTLGFALGAVQPMILSTLHVVTPAARHGEALGLRLMTLNASSVLMPMLFGTAGALLGVSLLFWLVGFSSAAAVPLAWRLRRFGT